MVEAGANILMCTPLVRFAEKIVGRRIAID